MRTREFYIQWFNLGYVPLVEEVQRQQEEEDQHQWVGVGAAPVSKCSGEERAGRVVPSGLVAIIMAFSGAGSWCLVVLVAVCAVLSGIPAFGTAYGVRAQCLPGYYGDTSDVGGCVLCTGYAVGTVQRGGPVPADEVAGAGGFMSPASVAVSGSGDVLAVVFGRAIHVYSWSGVAWVQRGNDIESAAAGTGLFGSVVALSEDGNIVASSDPFASTDAVPFGDFVADDHRGAVAVFSWDGASWSPMGSTIVGGQEISHLGATMGLSALGSVLVVSENGESVGRALVYVWDTGTNDWMLRGAPLVGSGLLVSYGTHVAMSSDGDVVAVRSDGRTADGVVSRIIIVYEWVSGNSRYEREGEALVDVVVGSFGDTGPLALSGDGLVVAVGVGVEEQSLGLKGGVRVFRRDGGEWVQMGSRIGGAAAGDLVAGDLTGAASVALSENGHALLVSSRGADSDRGSLAVYVWSSEDWEQRGDVVAGSVPGMEFGSITALSSDGTVVAAGSRLGSGVRVFNHTAEDENVDDTMCQAAYNDDSAAYLADLGMCSGEGSVDVCVVCAGVEYPLGPARACGVCPPGEYRNATSYTCDPCPANTAECQAVFGSIERSMDASLTCGGVVSGCVGPLPIGGCGPNCSPGYYVDASDGGTCVLCTGHAVGTVERDDPVPAGSASPVSLAVSGSGAVLAVVFDRAIHVYSWSGVAWVQRGNDIESAAAGTGRFGSVVALSEDGNIVASSDPFAGSSAPPVGGFVPVGHRGAVAVFIWDGASWSPMGSTIVGGQVDSSLGENMGLSALGSVLVVSERVEYPAPGRRAFVYVWDTGTNDWMLRGAPLVGPPVVGSFGGGVAISSDGDVVAVRTSGFIPSFSDDGVIYVYEWVSGNSRYERVGAPLEGVMGTSYGGTGSVALSGDGLVLAARLDGGSANGGQGDNVRVFGRHGEEWVPMGSRIRGAAVSDLTGASVALSEDGHVLLVSSIRADSRTGSLTVYVWSSEDWERRGGVLVGSRPGMQFGRIAALSSDGKVVAASGSFRGGVRVFDLTAELDNAGDAACRAVYNDDYAAYLAGRGVCNGRGSVDVCVVCAGGEYPIGPARGCDVCPPGEYRHATSYACDPCPANSAECQAVFGSGAWALDSSLTCGGLVSGCVATTGLQCSAGYYGDTGDGGACVLCTGHAVGTVQRGGPVPADEIAFADAFASPTSVAVSGSGSVLAVGFSDAAVGGVRLVGVVRVYSWSGVAWVQRGNDIDGAAAGGGFGTAVAVSEDGNIVSGSAPASRGVSEAPAFVAVFMWDGASWSPRGSPIVGGQEEGYFFGSSMGMSASGSVLVASELYGFVSDRVSRAFVYVWDADTSDWVLRGAPLVGPAVTPVFGVSVAMSGDGDVVVVASHGIEIGLGEGSICVYEWVSGTLQYEKVGNPVVDVPGDDLEEAISLLRCLVMDWSWLLVLESGE